MASSILEGINTHSEDTMMLHRTVSPSYCQTLPLAPRLEDNITLVEGARDSQVCDLWERGDAIKRPEPDRFTTAVNFDQNT